MLLLFEKDNFLYAMCKMDLKFPISYQNKVFETGAQFIYLLPEEVNAILIRNGNLRFATTDHDFMKLNLGEFNDRIRNKDFIVNHYMDITEEDENTVTLEGKVEEKVVVDETVVEEKIEEEVIIDKPVLEEKVKEVEPAVEPNDNKKKRHKQNQGGDK